MISIARLFHCFKSSKTIAVCVHQGMQVVLVKFSFLGSGSRSKKASVAQTAVREHVAALAMPISIVVILRVV